MLLGHLRHRRRVRLAEDLHHLLVGKPTLANGLSVSGEASSHASNGPKNTQQITAIPGVVKVLDTTKPTAARAIALLEEIGGVTEITVAGATVPSARQDHSRSGTELE